MPPARGGQFDGTSRRVPCAGADPSQITPLARLLPPGYSRLIAITSRFAALPTYGCFVPGYLLIVPRAHVLPFGQLDVSAPAEAQSLIEQLTDRLRAMYDLPILGFEYGSASTGIRRIEHAHRHLLPSPADLVGWLNERLTGQAIGSLADLPSDASYIAVRDQDGVLHAHEAGRSAAEAAQTHQQMRLRRTVAALDPRVNDDAWDWAEHRHLPLIWSTVTDLTTPTRPTAARTAR